MPTQYSLLRSACVSCTITLIWQQDEVTDTSTNHRQNLQFEPYISKNLRIGEFSVFLEGNVVCHCVQNSIPDNIPYGLYVDNIRQNWYLQLYENFTKFILSRLLTCLRYKVAEFGN